MTLARLLTVYGLLSMGVMFPPNWPTKPLLNGVKVSWWDLTFVNKAFCSVEHWVAFCRHKRQISHSHSHVLTCSPVECDIVVCLTVVCPNKLVGGAVLLCVLEHRYRIAVIRQTDRLTISFCSNIAMFEINSLSFLMVATLSSGISSYLESYNC